MWRCDRYVALDLADGHRIEATVDAEHRKSILTVLPPLPQRTARPHLMASLLPQPTAVPPDLMCPDITSPALDLVGPRVTPAAIDLISPRAASADMDLVHFVKQASFRARPTPPARDRLRLPAVLSESPRLSKSPRTAPSKSPRTAPSKSPRTAKLAAAPASARGSPRLTSETPLTVETFLLPRHWKARKRLALLGARGLDQGSAEELCNSIEIERHDGHRATFLALACTSTSLLNLVSGVSWVAIAADMVGAAGRRNPRGLALVQWADPETRVASTFGDNPEPWFRHESGSPVSTQVALSAVRSAAGASRRARVHQLVLLGGRGTGAALFRAIAAASGVHADDLLYVSAAHVPGATKHLWQCVYQDRYGFARVPGLRANLSDPNDPEEAHEIPLVVKVGNLRALYAART